MASFGNPWDLDTALSQPSSVQPGDVIWLLGGTYHNRAMMAFDMNFTDGQPHEVALYFVDYENEIGSRRLVL